MSDSNLRKILDAMHASPPIAIRQDDEARITIRLRNGHEITFVAGLATDAEVKPKDLIGISPCLSALLDEPGWDHVVSF